jgi:hypothetical protein
MHPEHPALHQYEQLEMVNRSMTSTLRPQLKHSSITQADVHELFSEENLIMPKASRMNNVTRDVWTFYSHLNQRSAPAYDKVAFNFYEPIVQADINTMVFSKSITASSASSLFGNSTWLSRQWSRYCDQPLSIVGLPIINPYSPFARYWFLFMLVVDLVYTAFIMPVGTFIAKFQCISAIYECSTLVH